MHIFLNQGSLFSLATIVDPLLSPPSAGYPVVTRFQADGCWRKYFSLKCHNVQDHLGGGFKMFQIY